MTHTPGPWFVGGETIDGRQVITFSDPIVDGGSICETHMREEEEANALLIASAGMRL